VVDEVITSMTGVFVPIPEGVIKSLFGKVFLKFLLPWTPAGRATSLLRTGPFRRKRLYSGGLWDIPLAHARAYGIWRFHEAVILSGFCVGMGATDPRRSAQQALRNGNGAGAQCLAWRWWRMLGSVRGRAS